MSSADGPRDIVIYTEPSIAITAVTDETVGDHETGGNVLIRVTYTATGTARVIGTMTFKTSRAGVFSTGTELGISYDLIGNSSNQFTITIRAAAAPGPVNVWVNFTGLVIYSNVRKTFENPAISVSFTVVSKYLSIARVSGLEAFSPISTGAIGQATHVIPGTTATVRIVVVNNGPSAISLDYVRLMIRNETNQRFVGFVYANVT